MAPTPKLAPADLPNPYAHELPMWGGKDSLRAAVWEVLKTEPEGLAAEDISRRVTDGDYKLGGGSGTSEVGEVLQETIYYVPADTRMQDGKPVGSSSKWALAVHRPLRWGVAGTGLIASDMMAVASMIPGVIIQAVGAREDEDKAKAFVAQHGGKAAYGSYEEVAQNPDVDLVYVNPIHTTHKDTTELMLEHGKHVLCEKPIAVNSGLARQMIDKAKEKDLFLTEGLWTRWFPATQKVKQLIEADVIGPVNYVSAQIFVKMEEEVTRLHTLEMGGGGLLDCGMYVITIASWAFGTQRPTGVNGYGAISHNGVDVAGCVNLKYGHSAFASLYYSIEMDAAIIATIYGPKGRIHINHRAHNPESITLVLNGESSEGTHELRYPNPEKPAEIDHGEEEGGFNFGGSGGFIWQAMAVHSAVLKGRKEMADISHAETVMLMEVCDKLREQEHLGVEYPQDGAKPETVEGFDR